MTKFELQQAFAAAQLRIAELEGDVSALTSKGRKTEAALTVAIALHDKLVAKHVRRYTPPIASEASIAFRQACLAAKAQAIASGRSTWVGS